ncbi:MAG: hypothetical protein ACR2NM_09150 [Bythopirellula sp.]
MFHRIITASLIAALPVGFCSYGSDASAGDGHKRTISYQSKSDLFYNYQVGPNGGGAAAQMYISPRPIPAHVGHTYTTYQPLMPHEYMYKHTRSHYAHTQGAGWTRSKIRYRTHGLRLQDMFHRLSHKY